MEQRKLKYTPTSGDIDQLVSELMSAAPRFHKLHLKVTGEGSYAAHKALNELYDALPGHADSLAEQYQGATGKLLTLGETPSRSPLASVSEALGYLNQLYAQINSAQASCSFSEIINTMDEIKSTINSAKYKLMFLK